MSNRGLSQKMTFLVITLSLLIGIGTIFAEGFQYLIIAHDSFYDAARPLELWKHKKGIMTKMVRVPDGLTSEAIRDTIKKYQSEYVLLVGDRHYIPLGKYFSNWIYLGATWTDQYYADTTDDLEYKDDIYLGRLPCSTVVQCSIIVNKIIAYEKGDLRNGDWYKKATGVARDIDPDPEEWRELYRDAIRKIRNLLNNIGFTQVDTLFARDNANRYTVEDSVTQGRGYVVYRGGAYYTTDNWRTPMDVSPEEINNDSMPTIVISTTCRTMYNPFQPYERPTAAGNRWMRKCGSSTEPKGAAGFWGTSTHYFGPNPDFEDDQVYWRNAAAIRFFRAITDESVLNFGEAIRRAKDSAYLCCSLSTYPQSGWATACSVAYMEWNLLGDPELNLWTAVPQPLVVTHNSVIPTGSQTFIVGVKNQNNQPVSNALICAMMPNDTSVYEYGYTNEYGTIALQISPKDSGCLHVTVTARNHIPYEDSCLVEPILADATYPNQSHHLARATNSTELEWTFYANRSIFWQWMESENSRFLTYIGKGKYPSIAKKEQGSAWISYTTIDSLNCFIRGYSGTWKKVNIAQADSIGAPSLFLSVYPDQTGDFGDLGYIVYMAKSDETGQCIHFCAFDSLGVYYHTILDEGEVYEPSISITPKDLLHIVWRKEDRIYYVTTLDGITPDYIRNQGQPNWSDIYPISEPERTEPASNPFTETYGDTVFAAWRGPNEEGQFPGDIWRRARWIRYPPSRWEDPRNKSETPDNESNYPVMSTNFVTVWQEQVNDTNWDIWARFEPAATSQPIFETPTSSQFPHIAGYWDPTSVIQTFICNTIWTEQIDTNHFEIRFDQYEYPPAEDYDNSFYSVKIGDSNPSVYCIERDGHQQYGPYSVDYSNQGLKYRLPYLNPQYSYLLRAIIYRTGQNNWIEEFYTDSTLTATALFEPNKPETVWFQLPKESYENTEVLQEIEKIVGSQALIADLRLYQKEVFEDTSGGGGQSAGSFSLQKPSLYQSFPNPFKFRANIRYQLPIQSKVSLTIYDITGRAVRKLLDEVNKEPGLHTITWDGKDDRGRVLPNSVYFYRLKTERFTDSKRVIVIR